MVKKRLILPLLLLPFQEIIEFPILKLNGRTMEIESTFHMYVQPVVHPQLTPFCTEVRALQVGSKGARQELLDHWCLYRPLRESLGFISGEGKSTLDPAVGFLQSLPLYLGYSGHWKPKKSSGTVCSSFSNIFPSFNPYAS